MFKSIRLGSLAGIGIFVHWTFLLLLGFLLLSGLLSGQGLAASLGGLVFVVALFGCVVLHELGHALAARRYGIPTEDITLLPIGGVARLARIPERPEQELVVALAGPAVNVAIAGVLAAILLPWGGWEQMLAGESFLHGLLRVNLMLVAFNLLPAFPMDGGRVLRSLLALRMDYVRATDIAARVGQTMAVLFGLLGLLVVGNPILVLVGVFVFLGAGAEARQARLRARAAGSFSTAPGASGSPSAAGFGPGPMAVRDAMVRMFRVLPPQLRLDQIPPELLAGSQRDFPVVDGQMLVGLLQRRDLLAGLRENGSLTVGSVMRREFPTARMNEPLWGAVGRLAASQGNTLPVLHEGQLVGLLQMSDSDLPADGPGGSPTERPFHDRQPLEIG